MSAPLYFVQNSAMATTAAPVKQPTGAAIRTMVQLRPATGVVIRPVAWGVSFDGVTASAVPGQIELVEVDVAATMSTAYAVADIQAYNAEALLSLQTAGATGVPLNLSTTTSGFATAAVTENTVAASRMCDLQMVSPTGGYMQQWPLGREFMVQAQKYLRVRTTFAATVNMYCWILFEV